MNNSVYGKRTENLRKRVRARLVNNFGDYKKWVSFVSQKIFSRNFVAIHEIKPVLTLDKPIYVGFSILDLSRLLMYEFHYNYIAVKYGCCAKLLFKDTDSLVYQIETDDVYVGLYEDRGMFGFSDFPKDLRFYDVVNIKVTDKMKDEVRENIIKEFAGLKSKM